MRIVVHLMLALAAVLLGPAAAVAQVAACRVPARIAAPRLEGPSAGEPRRVVPIGGHTLALSWSPEQCRRLGGNPGAAFQCGDGRRFGFILHGLWPDGEDRAWPQYCAPAEPVAERTIRAMLCTTPSVQLIQHEWAKHGTCIAGDTPERYFARAAALYRAIRYPDMTALSRRPSLTVGGFARAFAAANPGLTPAMLRVTTTRTGWLDEVWLCRDVRFAPVRCPAHQRGGAARDRLRIWRGGGSL